MASSKQKPKGKPSERGERRISLNPLRVVQSTLQGRTFLTLDFFKRNWLYVVAGTVMMLMYISNKYVYQSDKAAIGELKVALNNARTDFVDAKATYKSRILESQMKTYLDSMGIKLNLSQEPPYKLHETNEQ